VNYSYDSGREEIIIAQKKSQKQKCDEGEEEEAASTREPEVSYAFDEEDECCSGKGLGHYAIPFKSIVTARFEANTKEQVMV